MNPCLFQFVHAGRCQSRSTLFRAHALETHMAFSRSCGELSLESMLMRTSGGSLFAGASQTSLDTAMSWKVGTPMEDWESLLPV